jgi:hypothetical protein
MIVAQEKGNMMWRYLPWPFHELYDCFLLFVLRRTNPEGERLLRFLLAKHKVLRRRLKAHQRASEK